MYWDVPRGASYGEKVMRKFKYTIKEEQVSHRMSVLGSITSGGMLVAWLALFLIGVR